MRMLDPAGATAVDAKALARRPATLAGVIGILDNSKPNARVLLERVAGGLREGFGARDVRVWGKPSSSHGAAAARLGVHGGGNAFGQAARANAVIGRAVRLALQNIGGARPGHEDRATQGHPGKYSYCVAENEAASPWTSLAADRGFAPGDSTVTVCGSEGPHTVNDHASHTADGIVATIAGTAAIVGHNNVYLGGEPLIALGPEHAATVAAAGWSKDDFKRAVWERARVPLASFSPENIARFAAMHPGGFRDRPPGATVPIARDWRDVMVIVVGGAGKHSAVIPTFGMTRSVTRRIDG